MITRTPKFDALVVGGRCAGAATAMLLARRGLRVLVIDRDAPGSDTLSTHALMRTAVVQLQRWGLLDHVIANGTPRIEQAVFHYGDERIPAKIRPRDGIDALYAPRRTILDPILVGAAMEAGAQFAYGARLLELVRGPDDRVIGAVVEDRDGRVQTITARVVIGADGIASTTARLVGATPRTRLHAAATIYGYWHDLPNEGYQWFNRPGASGGIIPTNDGLSCVFVLAPHARFRAELRHDITGSYHQLLRYLAPAVADAIADQPPTTLRPFAGRPSFVRRAWGPGWALVGDAGMFRDPCTAHGISDALRDAELLAAAVLHDTPASYAAYEATRDELSRELLDVTDRIASFAWDLPALSELHRRLNAAITAEVAYLADSVRSAA